MGKKERKKAQNKLEINTNNNNIVNTNDKTSSIATSTFPVNHTIQNRKGLDHIFNEPHNKRSIPLFFIATAAMFSIPFIIFFACFYAPSDLYPGKTADTHTRLMYAGFGAVISVQVVAFSFIYCAWQEEKKEEWNT